MIIMKSQGEIIYKNFLKWIYKISIEDLKNVHNLESALLDDLGRIFLYSGNNHLFKNLKKS